MCEGFIGSDGRPYIEAVMLFLEGEPKPEARNFLLDTGATATCISLEDAVYAGVTSESIEKGSVESIPISGFNGKEHQAFRINKDFLLMFADYNEELDSISIHVEMLDKILMMEGIPSPILGRDILNRFDLDISHTSDRVNIERHNFGGGINFRVSGEI